MTSDCNITYMVGHYRLVHNKRKVGKTVPVLSGGVCSVVRWYWNYGLMVGLTPQRLRLPPSKRRRRLLTSRLCRES